MNLTLGKMSDKKSLSIQEEEILMEQIKDLSLSLWRQKQNIVKGRWHNRNGWSKVAEKLYLIQNILYKIDIKNLLCISISKE